MAWRLYVIVRSAACWFALGLETVLLVTPYILTVAVSPEGRVALAIERLWIWIILKASRVELTAEGLENVQPGESYVVMANHRSLYDTPALHYFLARDRDLRFIGKKELVRIPIFGWGFALSRHVVIDRQNRARAIAALRKAAATGAGVSFMIMPEGTRNSGEELLPFKKGGFHLAIDTGLPILPVVIVGSDDLMRKGSWYILPGAIHVVVLPPIPTAGLGKDDVEPLLERTRSVIAEAYRRETADLAESRR
jgi:1-acyl-sn-glycerol-3-phosphate acyltransferase